MIRDFLANNIDLSYAEFQRKLIPQLDPEKILGVRTPVLKKFAKQISGREEAEEFMNNLPHQYFEENQLHSFLIAEMKDLDTCLFRFKEFVPYIDNWATSDQLTPRVFRKHPEAALELVPDYISSDHVYTIRKGIDILMSYYLDDLFDTRYLKMVAEIASDEYYVNMMRAWYYATALAKQYDDTIVYIENGELDKCTHNKSIQKAIESNRISVSQKEYLRTLKIK